MSDPISTPLVARRSFLTRLGTRATAVGAALLAARDARAQTPTSRSGAWQPTRHAQDDWMDQLPGKHRFVFDTTTPDGIGAALLFANNFFIANKSGYGLDDADAAVIVVGRHISTPFAYNDVIWAKYGAPMTVRTGFNDPKTKQPPTVNPFNAAGAELANRGTTLDALIKRGAHFAVCQMATRVFAGQIAQATGGNAEAVYNEIVANLVGNAHMVAAGIVAVNRAQERGYAAATAV